MFLPNPGIMAAGAQGRTYEDFVAHITALTTSTPHGWNEAGLFSKTRFISTANAQPTTELYGTPWANHYGTDFATPARIANHGLPSYEIFQEQITSNRQIFFDCQGIQPQSLFIEYWRNNFYSWYAEGGPYNASICNSILYWHQGRAWKMRPFLGLGPEPYDW